MGNRIKWKLVSLKAGEASEGLFLHNFNCVWKKRYENQESISPRRRKRASGELKKALRGGFPNEP